jgi:hypothetical protein
MSFYNSNIINTNSSELCAYEARWVYSLGVRDVNTTLAVQNGVLLFDQPTGYLRPLHGELRTPHPQGVADEHRRHRALLMQTVRTLFPGLEFIFVLLINQF